MEKNINWIKKIFSPYFLDELSIYKSVKIHAKELTGIILDIGCRDKPYRSLFTYEKYIGLDIIKGKEVDIVSDATNIPLNNNSIDGIFSTQVITDIYDIELFWKEVYSKLKRGGKMLLTVEFMVGKNDVPYDYCRFTDYYYKKKLDEIGFKNIDVIPNSTTLFTGAYIMNTGLWKLYIKFKENNKIYNIFFVPLIGYFMINNLWILLLNYILPKDYNAPLGYTILADK